MRDRRALVAVVIPIIVGAVGFLNLTQRPRFEAFHAVDVLQLLASGMCFGLALSALLMLLRGKR